MNEQVFQTLYKKVSTVIFIRLESSLTGNFVTSHAVGYRSHSATDLPFMKSILDQNLTGYSLVKKKCVMMEPSILPPVS